MFSRCFAEMPVFSNLNATKLDITIIVEHNKNVLILEVGCCFDSKSRGLLNKAGKISPSCTTNIWPWLQLQKKSQYLVFIFGSLHTCIGLSLGVSG